jgi:iron complex outermembrane receptor protein
MKFQAFSPVGISLPSPDPMRVCCRMKKLSLVVAFAGLFAGLFEALPAHAHAHANNDHRLEQLLSLSLEELLETTVTISTNTKQKLSKAPSVVSVITAEDIKATGATNLVEILQSVPGLHIRANLFGFRPQISLRGGAGTQSLLMVNGVPMRDLVWNTGIFWRGLPTSMIERVEIIRGPGSALFGSDASSGVINIITKTAGKIEQSEAGIRVGSFDTQAGWVQHGGNWNGFDVGMTAEVSHTNGHKPFIASDGQTANDANTGTSVSYAPGDAHYGYDNEEFRFSMSQGDWRLLADYMHKHNVEIGLTGGGVLDPASIGGDSRFNIQLQYDNAAFSKDWGLNAELRVSHLDYTSGNGFLENPPGYKATPTGAVYTDGVINQMRASERGMNIEFSGLYSGLKNHAIRLGGGFNWADLYSVEQFINKQIDPDGPIIPGPILVNVSDTLYAFAPEKARRIHYVYLQDVWKLADNWELTAGARYDHFSDFGATLNPRLALVWQGTDRLTTKLLYGQAFRAPSYLELYADTAATRSNSNLIPEETETWDLSFSYLASRDLKLGLSLYRFAQNNPILADSGKFQNAPSKTVHGVELEAQWQAARTLRISGNLSLREEPAPAIVVNPLPKHLAYLRTDWAFSPHWNWDVQANWVGKQETYGARTRIDAYTLVDTTLRYAHRRDWEFAASIRNLFDVDAREYSSSKISDNLPLPGRNFYAEVRYKF